MRLLACIAALTLSAAPAMAQQPWERAANLEQALARIIDDALPRTDQDWGLTWRSFGLRGGRDVFWHMLSPEDAREDLARDLHRRTGWLDAENGDADIVLCGDATTVQMLTLSTSSIREGRGDLDAELSKRRIVATLIRHDRGRTSGNDFDLDLRHDDRDRTRLSRSSHREWRIQAPGRHPATLIADHGCTPPGTRHATMCRTRWALIFTPISHGDPQERRLDACQSRQRYVH